MDDKFIYIPVIIDKTNPFLEINWLKIWTENTDRVKFDSINQDSINVLKVIANTREKLFKQLWVLY